MHTLWIWLICFIVGHDVPQMPLRTLPYTRITCRRCNKMYAGNCWIHPTRPFE
jgi:hypothetical protein